MKSKVKVNEILNLEILSGKAQSDRENKNEQNELKNTIIINGIPYSNNENLRTILENMQEKLPIWVCKPMAYRIKTKRNRNGQCLNNENEKDIFMIIGKQNKIRTYTCQQR